jgi:Na+/H+-translocating membrane pyrophosphatase
MNAINAINAQTLICTIPILGIIALIFTFIKSAWVTKQDPGTDRMVRIAADINKGAMAFLKAEYSILILFVVLIAGLLTINNVMTAVSFVSGAICSGLAGFIGMRVATKANVRTTNAARSSLGEALNVAFSGGSVMGMGVVGLGILGLSSLFALFTLKYGHSPDGISSVLEAITGFSFGASSIAFFARVGGGIYTKAADVGADHLSDRVANGCRLGYRNNVEPWHVDIVDTQVSDLERPIDQDVIGLLDRAKRRSIGGKAQEFLFCGSRWRRNTGARGLQICEPDKQ